MSVYESQAQESTTGIISPEESEESDDDSTICALIFCLILGCSALHD